MLRALLRGGLNIINPLRGISGVVMGVVMIAAITMGGLAGVSTALNESKSPQVVTSELDTVDDEVKSDIRANKSTLGATLTIALVQVPMWLTIESAKVGVGIGHAYPGAMEAWATVAPGVIVGLVLVGFYWQWGRIRRMEQ